MISRWLYLCVAASLLHASSACLGGSPPAVNMETSQAKSEETPPQETTHYQEEEEEQHREEREVEQPPVEDPASEGEQQREENFNFEDEGRPQSDYGSDFYTFTVKDIYDNDVSLDQLRGKLVLVVNVASECGHTEKNYQALVKLQEEMDSTELFYVVAFPCNQFGEQEPEDSETVANKMVEKYGMNFPMLGKVNVVGDDASEAWKFLTASAGFEPTWNFWKYLVNLDGHVITHYDENADMDQIARDVRAYMEDAQAYYREMEEANHQEL